MGALTHNGDVITGLPSTASQINYDNTSSGMAATQVQAAVDELKSGLTNLTHWINEGLSQESITVTEGYEQLKLYVTNASGGTVWAEMTILGEFLPSVIVLGTMTITRSGSTFTVTANPDNLYIKILSLHA